MHEVATGLGHGYWYAGEPAADPGIAVLEALRAFRSAETAMRQRTRVSMGMGENDILALRYLIRAQEQGRAVGPTELSHYLGISSASITMLIDRLERAGCVHRASSPSDRRALVLDVTEAGRAQVQAAVGRTNERMLDVAQSLDDDEARAVIRFLQQMREAVDRIDAPAHS